MHLLDLGAMKKISIFLFGTDRKRRNAMATIAPFDKCPPTVAPPPVPHVTLHHTIVD
jgi:hypothetical protein